MEIGLAVHRRTMQRPVDMRSVPIAALLLLAGCAATPAPQEFRLAYDSARNALEAGSYPDAIRLYEGLIARSGQDTVIDAVRLDYAHALLRAGRSDGALRVAREIVERDPQSRAAGHAKVVAAVAEHELAELSLAEGVPYEVARTRARVAYRSLGLVLRDHPTYDSAGVLTIRMRQLRERLASLEIAQLHADLVAESDAMAADRAADILREYAGTAAVAEARELLRRTIKLGETNEP